MKREQNASKTNSSEKNEITRRFEEIWDEQLDPDFIEKKRIKKQREDRLKNIDFGL